MAVLPEVRCLECSYQVRVFQPGGRGQQAVVERRRGGAVAGQFQMGRGLQEQGLGVLGVQAGGPLEAGRFGGVVDVFGRRVGAHGGHRSAGG